MKKAQTLEKLYNDLTLDTTEERLLLDEIKKPDAPDELVNQLLDLVNPDGKGGKKLDEIKFFERKLVEDVKLKLGVLEKMEDEDDAIAHIEEEEEQATKYADLKNRYQLLVSEIEEILEAMRIAYFQIRNFQQYEDRFERAQEMLTHLD